MNDAVNRLTKKEYEDSSYVAYVYDANGNMSEASDGTITFEFSYDAENKVTKVRDDTQGLEIEYAYDYNGNLLWIEDTSNNKINYYYDALNRVTDVVNGTTFATIEYATCCSLRMKLTLGNGCYTEYDYDDARRLTKITNKKSNGTVISSWDYSYDDVGNVTSQTDKDSDVTSYSYDDMYQLTAVDYPSGSDFGYQYDAVGNRTKMFEYTSSTITTTYTYDDADELTQWTTSTVTMTFTYASDGCLSTKSDGTDTWAYEWDFERRLTGFKKNGSYLVEYGYNPTGTRRYSSDSTLGLTNFFDHGKHVLGDYNSNWSLKTSYVRLPKCLEIVGMLDRTADPTPVYYIAKDGQMSTRELLNSSENVVTRYSYDAWGDPTETKLVGNRSTQFRFYALMYDLRSEAYLGSITPFDPEVGRLLNSVGISAVTHLMACVTLTEPVDWTDSWWWFCASGNNDACCATNYAKCKTEEGEQAEDPRILALPTDPVLGSYGDVKVVVWPFVFGRGDSCAKKLATCNYWCRLKVDFGIWCGDESHRPSGLEDCYTSQYEGDPGSARWNEMCHADGDYWYWAWDGICWPYVAYWYHGLRGEQDAMTMDAYQIYDVCKNQGRKWFTLWTPGFHKSRDLFDDRDGTWRYNPPAGVLTPW